MSRGRPLDRKRKNGKGDKLNADSDKPCADRVGRDTWRRGRECERRGSRERESVRDGVRAEGKDQWEAAAVLAGGGDEN